MAEQSLCQWQLGEPYVFLHDLMAVATPVVFGTASFAALSKPDA
jgi:hypothetical protein